MLVSGGSSVECIAALAHLARDGALRSERDNSCDRQKHPPGRVVVRPDLDFVNRPRASDWFPAVAW